MTQYLEWLWAVFAIILFVGEIFTAGFVLMCFGLGAAIASALAFLGVGLVWQLIAFIVVSVVAVAFSRPFANRISNSNTGEVGIDRVLNREGVVLEAIDPDSRSGVVRVLSETWSADSADRLPIPVGARVEVLAVEGAHLVVREIETAAG